MVSLVHVCFRDLNSSGITDSTASECDSERTSSYSQSVRERTDTVSESESKIYTDTANPQNFQMCRNVKLK